MLHAEEQSSLSFNISFSSDAHPNGITGRAFLIISRDNRREPRFQVGTLGVPFWGKNINLLKTGEQATIDESVFGYPLESIRDIPPGDYFVQGFVNIYTEFKRSDGHTIWIHNDQWEGQKWNRSPGNLYSDVGKVTIDHAESRSIDITCNQVIPPVTIPADTQWVKRIKFKSEILSEFWGQSIYLGATVLLPKDYEKHSDVFYPVNYIQGHFSLRAPNRFQEPDPEAEDPSAREGNSFYKLWNSEECPRMIAVTFQHPCPYYDDSYAVNSPNTGPYGDAIMKELIPAVERQFRIIREPYARILSGGSTGGWISLALQILHADFFGGVFSLCPDPVDFRCFQCVDIYEDVNAYYKETGWHKIPTASDRTTMGIVTLTFKQRNHMELVLGTKGRSGGQIDIFEAVFGPTGKDGYVKPLFDKLTGSLDPEVVEYWKDHYDLRYYLEKNWSWLGPKLLGKIHIYTGDMDTHYLNNAVKLIDEFLSKVENPHFDGVIRYGDGQPHCWGPRGKELLELMAKQVTKNTPTPEDANQWKYEK